MFVFKSIQKAEFLPTEWDELASNYFQRKKFLHHTEMYNPCKQRYYLCYENETLLAGAVVYSLRLDLLTFIRIKSPIMMNISGIPCSVSGPGIFGEKTAIDALKNHITSVEKGFVLFLNLEEKPDSGKYTWGKTLPTIVLSNRFLNWNDYSNSFRSDYRRRLNRINQTNPDLRFQKTACSSFDETMHKQYLEVYKRSKEKLEKLDIAFFSNLPQEFSLTICYDTNTVVGWNISLESDNTFYFFLGGIDYKSNKRLSTYLRLLSNLLHDGINKKSTFIDLGQTAEIAKMRMGGKPVDRYMEAYHSNWVFNRLIRLSKPLLEYKKKLENTNAFKEETK